MGSTTKYQLPYPELSDTPDVPRDMKVLADRVEAVIGSISTAVDSLLKDFVMPLPTKSSSSGSQGVGITANSWQSWSAHSCTLQNPSTRMDLMVRVVQSGWIVFNGTTTSRTVYFEPKLAGGTSIWGRSDRIDSQKVGSVSSAPHRYTGAFSEKWVRLDPVASVTATLQARSNPASFGALLRYGTVAIMPVGYISSGTVPPWDDELDIDWDIQNPTTP